MATFTKKHNSAKVLLEGQSKRADYAETWGKLKATDYIELMKTAVEGVHWNGLKLKSTITKKVLVEYFGESCEWHHVTNSKGKVVKMYFWDTLNLPDAVSHCLKSVLYKNGLIDFDTNYNADYLDDLV